MLWPEGSTDFSPPSPTGTRPTCSTKWPGSSGDAALIAGVVTDRDEKTYNTEVLWEPGRGAVDFYDKKHPVPFGEYVPDRAFWSRSRPT